MPRLKPLAHIDSHTLLVKRIFTNYEISIVEKGSEDKIVYSIPIIRNGNDTIILQNHDKEIFSYN